MKNSAWYNKLWQNKLHELPLEGDADLSWQKIQGLLDKNMPVNYPSAQKPIKSFGLKLIKVLAIVASTALVFYGVKHLVSTSGKSNKKPAKSTIKMHSVDSIKINTAIENKPVSDSITIDNNKSQDSVSEYKKTTPVNNNGKTVDANNTSSVNHINTSSQKSGDSINKTLLINSARHNTVLVNVTNGSTVTVINSNNHATKGRYSHSKRASNGKYLRNNKQNYGHRIPAPAAGNPNFTDYRGTSVNAANQVISEDSNNKTIAPQKKVSAPDTTNKANTSSSTSNKPENSTGQKLSTPANSKDVKNVKTNSKKSTSNSKFTLGVTAGVNVSSIPGGGASPFLGLVGTYNLTSKTSIGLGANVLQKTINGSYTNSNYKYTTVIDTNKQVTNTADKIVVNSSEKIYTLNMPLFITYRQSDKLSFIGGPVIGLSVHTNSVKNILSPISKPIDTLNAYKIISSAASNTTISSKINFSLFGGVKLNFNRFFIEGNYVWGLSPYTINSSLGSSKIYYSSYQFGIGYYLFKPKP